MKRYLTLVTIVLSLLIVEASFALATPESGNSNQDQEKRVRTEDLPPSVQKTVREQSQGAIIKGLAREIEDGKTNYEVELSINGHHKDVLIDPTGAVVEIEEQVTLEQLPAAVKASIVQHAGKGKIGIIESITEGAGVVAYEAHVKRAGRSFEIKVNPDGQLLSRDKD